MTKWDCTVDSAGNLLTRYVYATHTNVPDYLVRNGVTYRLVTDERGSVRLVVNASTGAVVSSLNYDVWGNVTSSTNATFQPFGFAGGLRDDATNLTHFGAREYAPELGRWTRKDPIGFNGGLTDLYGYVANDPVNWVDEDGHTWKESSMYFGKWLIGWPIPTDFGPGTNQVEDMKNAQGVQDARDAFYAKNNGKICTSRSALTNYKASFGLSGLWDAGWNSTQQFIGSYRVDITPNTDGTVNINLTNSTSFTSFSYGIGPSWDGGPGGTQTQVYHWTEQGR
jgi:RHS repeat-associated protein